MKRPIWPSIVWSPAKTLITRSESFGLFGIVRPLIHHLIKSRLVMVKIARSTLLHLLLFSFIISPNFGIDGVFFRLCVGLCKI